MSYGTLISSVVVGAGGSANIAFTSIPSTYTDLVLVLSVASSVAGTNSDNVFAQFNSVTTGYGNTGLSGTGGSSAAGQNYNALTSKVFVGTSSAVGVSGPGWGTATVLIPNYAGSTNKPLHTQVAAEGYSTAANDTVNVVSAGIMSNTAAINSITLTNASGSNFAQNSIVSLYGVK